MVNFGTTPAVLYLVLRYASLHSQCSCFTWLQGAHTALQQVQVLCRHEKQILTADQDMSALLNRIALYKQRAMLLFEVSCHKHALHTADLVG